MRRHHHGAFDIAATHSVAGVASLRQTAAALDRRGTPLTGDNLMILRDGVRAALVTGPDGHRFLVEERTADGPSATAPENAAGMSKPGSF